MIKIDEKRMERKIISNINKQGLASIIGTSSKSVQ